LALTVGSSANPRYAVRMPSIGPLELGIVLLIVLVVFGPKRLPGLGRQLGSGMREFKESITGKDRDDDDEDATDETRARHELDPAPGTPSEPEVVPGQARTEDRAATRSDS
jgi:sec-independent protein translocase protein TatA